ncbi:MAG: tRNA(Ile)-lysidine synthetase, partial [Thermoleophilia bacterium]|nr:tRNA(Ile)-lysidine synthetase [Thermoleophilia bacterium]
MFQPGQVAGVGVSGGADSVALLYILHELAPRWNLQLKVLHVNHQLRGREADADEE